MPLVDRTDSVLTVVDTQPGFFDHGRMTDSERRRAARTVERIAWLTGLATLIEVPTVVVEEGTEQHGRTDARIVDRAAPGTVVHRRATYSLTGSDSAVEALSSTGRGTAVLVGFETDVCVAQSAVDLLDRGLRVVIVEDATYSTGNNHERGLKRMTQAGAEWNHTKGLALEWLRAVDYGREMWRAATERFGAFPADTHERQSPFATG
jgi:nicotinamidase-related amidase